MGGVLAKAAADGHRTVLVFGTKGEHGEVDDGFLADGETLAERRVQETERSAEILGVQRLEWLGYTDSGMMGTPENDLPGSFFAQTMLPAAHAGNEEARDGWSLEDVEKEHIQRVLRRQKGNVTNTARQLGISRTTLWRKMNKFRLARPGA